MSENRTQPGPIRRQAARLAQLGLVESCVPNRDRTRYTIVTAAGDTATYPREQVPAYLDGLAHAAWITEKAREQVAKREPRPVRLAALEPQPIPEADRPVFLDPFGPAEGPDA